MITAAAITKAAPMIIMFLFLSGPWNIAIASLRSVVLYPKEEAARDGWLGVGEAEGTEPPGRRTHGAQGPLLGPQSLTRQGYIGSIRGTDRASVQERAAAAGVGLLSPWQFLQD